MTYRVAPSCLAVLRQANALWPNRSKASDGTVGDTSHSRRVSDHNPDAFGWVHAVDLTHDPVNGCDAHAWANAVVARRDKRVKYVISNLRIASASQVGDHAPWTWRPYDGTNPHIKHAHVSIHHTDEARKDTSSWFDPANSEEADMLFPGTQTVAVPNRGPRQSDNRWAMWGWRPTGEVFCWNFTPDMPQRVPSAEDRKKITANGASVIGLHPRPDGKFGYVLVTDQADDHGGLSTFTF